jgi:hypothetical protein
MGKPEGRRPFVRLGCKLENNIETNVTEIGWYCVD